MLRRSLFAVAMLLLATKAIAVEPVTLTGKVVAVVDGDTMTVLDGANVHHKIRLHGIDAPESEQAFGNKSKEALATLTMGKQVTVDVTGQDHYEEHEWGTVIVAGEDINLRMVRDGWAWHYLKYAPDDPFLAAAEADARIDKCGLWADTAKPVAPWTYRESKAAKRQQAIPSHPTTPIDPSATTSSCPRPHRPDRNRTPLAYSRVGIRGCLRACRWRRR